MSGKQSNHAVELLRRAVRRTCCVAVALSVCCAVGCNQTETIDTPPGEVVAHGRAATDFTLEVRVYPLSDGEQTNAPHALYIVQPDRSLRGGFHARARSSYPPLIRRLAPAQIDRVATLVEAAGLTEPPGGATPNASAHLRGELRSGGERFTIDHPVNNATRRDLLAELHGLATWRDGRPDADQPTADTATTRVVEPQPREDDDPTPADIANPDRAEDDEPLIPLIPSPED